MTPFTLSSDANPNPNNAGGKSTQYLINLAVSQGPGSNNINYLNAYNAIYNDLVAQNAAGNAIDPGVLAWFSQAGLVNTEQYHATQAGAFIWGYTEAAAISEGATISTANLQTASNTIASNVFVTLKNASTPFLFDATTNGSFSIKNIIANDAGAGLQVLKTDYASANFDNAIWGGTLFATTELNDPTYFSDYNVTLGLGSRDAAAIVAGFETGAISALQVNPGVNITNINNGLDLDVSTLIKAALSTGAPSLLPSWLSNPTWTLGANASSPTTSGNQVASGNIEIYDNATGVGLTLTGSTNSAGLGDIYQPTGTTGSIGVPTANSVEITDGSSGSGVTYETVNNSNGNVSFTDAAGDSFASYLSSQLAGSTMQITANGVSVYNSSNQIQNSTQEIGVGNGLNAALDNVWNSAGQGSTKVDIPGQSSTKFWLKDDGIGLARDGGNNLYVYQNGAFTPFTSAPALAGYAVIMIDDNNDIIGTTGGSGSVIYSGATANFTGGTLHSVLGPNGEPFFAAGLSRDGSIIVGYTQSGGTSTFYARKNGTFTQINIPTYTDPTTGTAFSMAVAGVNDNGVIVGSYSINNAGQGGIVDATYNYQTGALTLLPQNPNEGSGGTHVAGINDSGEIVGWSYLSNVAHTFTYTNGTYVDISVNLPTAGTFAQGNQALGITNTGSVTLWNISFAANGASSADAYIVNPSSTTAVTSTLNILSNGIVDLRSVSQLTAPTTINLAAGNNTVYVGAANETIVGTTGNNAFNVTSATAGAIINAGSGQNVLNVSGGGTVTMGSNMTGIQTVNLAAPPSGQTQTAYSFTETTNAGLTIVDSSNDTGDTISIYGTGGNHSITIQDTITNSSGANYNNTINAGNTSGNNTLTVGDGSYDLIRTDFSTGSNTLTAGNGSNDYLDATSSHGVNNLTVGSGSNNILDVSFGAGNDTLTAMTGSSDWLDAESSTGSNTLVVGNGNNNQLDTSFSSGNNTLTAGNGSNTYLNAGVTQGVNILRAGDGNNDTLDVGFSAKNNTLTAGNGNGDYLTANSSSGNNILTAGNGSNDIFSAVWSTGQNTFNAGTGTTTLYGGEGYTTYRFGSIFGQDVLWNSGSSAGQGASAVLGEVDFGASETSQNLWFTQSGSDLVVRLLGTSETITVKGWFGSNAGAQVQAFYVSNGFKLSNTAVASLVTAMANYQTANPTFSPSAPGTTMPSSLNTAITSAWVRYYDSTTTNGDGSWVGTLNDRFNGNWQYIKDYYTSANVLKESYELFNDGTATDTAKISGITLTSNDTVGETLNTSSAGGDTVNVAAGSQYTVNLIDAGGDVVNAGSGNTVNINNNGGTQEDWIGISSGTVHLLDHSWADIYGGSNTITVGQNAAIGVQSGNNNNLTVGNGSYVYVNGGTGDTITSTGATIFEAAGVSMSLIGEGNVIYAANGSTMSIAGNGDYAHDDYVSASNCTITIADNSRVDVYGGGNTITAGQNDVIGVQNGNGNSVTIGGNGTIYINSGNSDTIYASNETVNAQSGVTVTVSGGNDIVYAANGDTVNVTGNGQYGTDNYVVQSSGTVTVANNAHADVYGGGNTVTVGQNALLGIQYGNNNTITMGSNSQIYVNDGSTETINGGGNDQYNFASTFGQDTVNNGTALTTANGSVGFGSGVTDENLWFKHVGNNLEIDLVGTSDKITISNWYGANAGAQVQDFYAGGLTLDTQIAQLVSAMATYVSSTGFNPTASGATIPPGSSSSAAQTLQNAIAASWHH